MNNAVTWIPSRDRPHEVFAYVPDVPQAPLQGFDVILTDTAYKEARFAKSTLARMQFQYDGAVARELNAPNTLVARRLFLSSQAIPEDVACLSEAVRFYFRLHGGHLALHFDALQGVLPDQLDVVREAFLETNIYARKQVKPLQHHPFKGVDAFWVHYFGIGKGWDSEYETTWNNEKEDARKLLENRTAIDKRARDIFPDGINFQRRR